jgi:hypothetical protein
MELLKVYRCAKDSRALTTPGDNTNKEPVPAVQTFLYTNDPVSLKRPNSWTKSRQKSSFLPCYTQSPLLMDCTEYGEYYTIFFGFLQLCLEISTATAGGGGGDVWVNIYLESKLFPGKQNIVENFGEICTLIISFGSQCFDHQTIDH